MPPFKAIPSDHPHRRQLARLEKDAELIISRALMQLRRDIMRGITRVNVMDALIALRSRDVNERLRQSLYDAILLAANAGGKDGIEQVERDIFGVKAAPISFDWTLINSAVSKWARAQSFLLTYANVWSITESTARKLRIEIDNFVQSPDMTINQLGKRLTNLFDDTRAATIAITEVTRAFAAGSVEAWRVSGVVEGKRWNTAVDEMVCPICRPLNGKEIPIDDIFPGGLSYPPGHPKCRCWVTPVVIVDEN